MVIETEWFADELLSSNDEGATGVRESETNRTLVHAENGGVTVLPLRLTLKTNVLKSERSPVTNLLHSFIKDGPVTTYVASSQFYERIRMNNTRA